MEKLLRHYSKEDIKNYAIKKYGPNLSDLELEMYINGCKFANDNIDIYDCWDNLSWYEKERFIEDNKYDFEDEYYECLSLYDIWDIKPANEQLEFLCDKLKEFYPHEIVSKLKNKDIINNLYKELHS